MKQGQPSILTVGELLTSPTKYDKQKVQVFGKVSDLGLIDEPFLKLDGKLLVCYVYNNTNLQSQLSEVKNGDPMIVTGIFHRDSITLYAEHIRPSKDIRQAEEIPQSKPISQDEAIAKVKACVIWMRKGAITEENIRIDKMELRPPMENEMSFIREWCSIAGVDKEPPELIWMVSITQLFMDVGPRSGSFILDAYSGEIIYGLLLD